MKHTHSGPRLVSIADAQHMLGGVARQTIYNLVSRKELETVHIGRRHMVLLESVEKLIEARRD